MILCLDLIEKLVLLDKTINQRAKKEEVSRVQNSIFMETAVSFWKVFHILLLTVEVEEVR